jgi:hypothetical protein
MYLYAFNEQLCTLFFFLRVCRTCVSTLTNNISMYILLYYIRILFAGDNNMVELYSINLGPIFGIIGAII